MVAAASGPTLRLMVEQFVAASDLYAMLVGSTFTFDADLHQWRSSIAGEVVGDGYTQGGVPLTGVDTFLDTDTNSVLLVADDVEFGNLTVSDVGWLVVYQRSGAATSNSIIAAFSFAPVTLTGSQFIFEWSVRFTPNPLRGIIGEYNY